MGVDTKGLLNKNVSVQEIAMLLETCAENVNIIDNGRGYYSVQYTYKSENRVLSVFENYPSETLNGEVITYLMLVKYGFSNEMMYKLVSYFGGHYLEDDCSGDDPVYLAKTSDYVESEAVKADKSILALLAEYKIPSKHKFEIVKLIQENSEALVALSKKLG